MKLNKPFEPEDHFKGNYSKKEQKCPVVEKYHMMDAFDYLIDSSKQQSFNLDIDFNGQINGIFEEPLELETKCKHDPINVGFAKPKMVCRKCDKDL